MKKVQNGEDMKVGLRAEKYLHTHEMTQILFYDLNVIMFHLTVF